MAQRAMRYNIMAGWLQIEHIRASAMKHTNYEETHYNIQWKDHLGKCVHGRYNSIRKAYFIIVHIAST